MPFPFFRLPFELRYIIYQYIFTPEYRDSLIVIDLSPPGRLSRLDRLDIGQRSANIGLDCQALPLMRTCQQAHDESTSILYGDNTFGFDDLRYDDLTLDYSDSYSDYCELTHFYLFLSKIGRANRMKLRHLDLKFCTYSIFTVPGEDTVWDACYNPDLKVTSSISYALNLLSESHRLQSLVLHFSGSHRGMVRFSFWFSKDSELYRNLAQFKAIRKLKCTVNMDGLDELEGSKNAVYEEAVDNYRGLKAELAAGYALESECISSPSKKNGLQSDPVSESGALS